MPRHDRIIDFFQGAHVTLILKIKQTVPGDTPDEVITGNAMVQGFLIEADDDLLYIAENPKNGVSEAVERKSIFRIIMTDNREEAEMPETPPVPLDEMN